MEYITLEEFKKKYQNNEYLLRDDEYLGQDGLPYCKNCNGKRWCEFDNGAVAFHCLCKCQEEKRNENEKQEKVNKIIADFKNRQKSSLLNKRYSNAIFKNATITKNNKQIYRQCYNYTQNIEAVKNENIGMYIYGNNSSGKTHLTACMCNEIVKQGYWCVYTNLATILKEIQATYNNFNRLNENDILHKLNNYDFVFIDDLGKEFIGREYNSSNSKWAEQKLFEIINARYNASKPIIFSSNYSIGELSNILKLDIAIVERINEMSTKVIKLEGDDFRQNAIKEKKDILKKLGI